MPSYEIFKQKTSQFLNDPRGFLAKTAQTLIMVAIVFSLVDFTLDLIWKPFYIKNLSFFKTTEVVIVIIFTIEYLARLWSSPKRLKHITNFYNIIDLIAILPFYLSSMNFSFLRALRLMRILRLARLLRLAKIFRHFWDNAFRNACSLGRIVQENIIKNLLIIIFLIFIHESIVDLIKNISPESYSDLILASSIFAVAAMFGFFSFSYADVNPYKPTERILAHLTSGLLLLPIGVMFSILQATLEQELNIRPTIIICCVWLVFASIVLWDFSNVNKIKKNLDN